jgi:hypothetical protein
MAAKKVKSGGEEMSSGEAIRMLAIVSTWLGAHPSEPGPEQVDEMQEKVDEIQGILNEILDGMEDQLAEEEEIL